MPTPQRPGADAPRRALKLGCAALCAAGVMAGQARSATYLLSPDDLSTRAIQFDMAWEDPTFSQPRWVELWSAGVDLAHNVMGYHRDGPGTGPMFSENESACQADVPSMACVFDDGHSKFFYVKPYDWREPYSDGYLYFRSEVLDVSPTATVRLTVADTAPPDLPTPEPATWALLVAGFFAAGAALRIRTASRGPSTWLASTK